MSREIKFRAWYKDGNTMHYDCLPLGGWDNWWIAFDNDKKYDGEFTVGKDIEIMQYTGLKDKNGIDIFEGDIVKYRRIIRKKEVWFEAVIKWDNGFLLHPNKTAMQDHFAIECSLPSINVIGNIHQHSHLLELPK